MDEKRPASEATPASAPAGWYAVESGPGTLRWWDGREWTEHFAGEPRPTTPTPTRPQQPLRRRRPWLGFLIAGLAILLVVVIVVVVAVVDLVPRATSALTQTNNLPGNSAHPGCSGQLGPTGASTRYAMGTGDLYYLPTQNSSLSQTAAALRALVYFMNVDYAGDLKGAKADGRWPQSLTSNKRGMVTASGNRAIGNYVPPGSSIRYCLQSDGSFILEMATPAGDEAVAYSSESTDYWAWCADTDNTCTTNSPVAPRAGKPTE